MTRTNTLKPLAPPLLVYLSGSYADRLKILGRAREIEAHSREMGFPIVSTARWLLGEHEAKEGRGTLEEMADWALWDIEDIQSASVFVQFTETPSTTGGMHCEFGAAMLSGGKQVVVCGPVGNPFQALPWVLRMADWARVREWLLIRAVEQGDKWKEAA